VPPLKIQRLKNVFSYPPAISDGYGKAPFIGKLSNVSVLQAAHGASTGANAGNHPRWNGVRAVPVTICG